MTRAKNDDLTSPRAEESVLFVIDASASVFPRSAATVFHRGCEVLTIREYVPTRCDTPVAVRQALAYTQV
jgi:hypothetical protein